MLLFVVYLLVVGTLAGCAARLVVPGRGPASLAQTVGVGMVGSFAGGFIGWALFGADLAEGAVQSAGLVGAVAGALLLLSALRAVGGRRHYPGT